MALGLLCSPATAAHVGSKASWPKIYNGSCLRSCITFGPEMTKVRIACLLVSWECWDGLNH